MATPQYIKNAQNKYNSKFDIIQIKFPKGTKERIRSVLNDDQSITGFCKEIIMHYLENRGAGWEFQKCFQNMQDVGADPKRMDMNRDVRELEKSEAEVDETHTEPLPNNEPCIENGFDGLKAADWTLEKHKGIVPYPPHWASENTTWEAGIREWCEPLPFE